MSTDNSGYRTGRYAPLDGGELARLAQLLERYLHHRPRTPTPAVDRLHAEIVLAAGIVR